ncbi:hypothetical protein L6452_08795 [Arctium lappa]|uniref:Uncharacterized protein n=1 Tax=Arctium lappa TaxID=4217 RepID=A0ACB9DIW7_ARCLA|nr:hypothetical protein L6452_08795 [Arctium lappa]
MSEVPGLYDHLSMQLARRIPEFKTFWTKLSENDEVNETEKRLKSAKVHLPFNYAKTNNSYNENPIYQKKKTFSSDFFPSYSEKEMEAKPIQEIFEKNSMPVNGAKSTKVDNSVSVKAKNAKGTQSLKRKRLLIMYRSGLGKKRYCPILKKNIAEQSDSATTSFLQSWDMVNFKAKRCSVRNEAGEELLVGTRESDVYTINLSNVQTDKKVCLMTKASMQQSWLWHRRLSHLNFRYINNLVSGKLVKGLPELKYEREHLCAACEKGKMKRAPHKPNPEPSTNAPLELLHMDLCGPMRTQSLGGKKYILVIMDDYSRYTWVKFLRSKDETPDVLITFLKTTQLNLQKPVKFLRTDNGTEFKNQKVEEYIESVGISHQYYAARMP